MESIIRDLKDTLENLGSYFHLNELAYLALTQKVEHAVRDRLAYALFRLWETDPSILVCREWCRCDLAVLQTSNKRTLPKLLIEAKAVGSADIIKTGARWNFPECIEKDLWKLHELAIKKGDINIPPFSFALVIVTHPHGPAAVAFSPAIKYYKLSSRWAKLSHDFAKIDSRLDEFMGRLEKIYSCVLDAGKAFGTDVSIILWLYKLPAEEVPQLQ